MSWTISVLGKLNPTICQSLSVSHGLISALPPNREKLDP